MIAFGRFFQGRVQAFPAVLAKRMVIKKAKKQLHLVFSLRHSCRRPSGSGGAPSGCYDRCKPWLPYQLARADLAFKSPLACTIKPILIRGQSKLSIRMVKQSQANIKSDDFHAEFIGSDRSFLSIIGRGLAKMVLWMAPALTTVSAIILSIQASRHPAEASKHLRSGDLHTAELAIENSDLKFKSPPSNR